MSELASMKESLTKMAAEAEVTARNMDELEPILEKVFKTAKRLSELLVKINFINAVFSGAIDENFEQKLTKGDDYVT